MKLAHLIPKALKQFLIEREAYNPCMANVDAEMLRYYRSVIEESYQLNYLFDWDKSPEGFPYWSALYREYMGNIYDTDSYSVQELKQFLITREAYEQCLLNLDAEHLQEFFTIDSTNTLADYFVWWNTPQGYVYWATLDEEYSRGIHETNPSHNKGT